MDIEPAKEGVTHELVSFAVNTRFADLPGRDHRGRQALHRRRDRRDHRRFHQARSGYPAKVCAGSFWRI